MKHVLLGAALLAPFLATYASYQPQTKSVGIGNERCERLFQGIWGIEAPFIGERDFAYRSWVAGYLSGLNEGEGHARDLDEAQSWYQLDDIHRSADAKTRMEYLKVAENAVSMDYEHYQSFLESDRVLRRQGSNEPFTGKVICRETALGYRLVFQVDVVDGRPHGLETASGGDLKVFKESYWVRGRKNGMETQWYPNGGKRSEVEYVDGRRQGEQTEWDEDGQLDRTLVWRDDLQDGPETFWYPSGQMARQISWARGRQHGLDVGWHENGQKEQETSMVNGVGQGPYTYWYENGQKKVQGTLLDGKPEGMFRKWSETGDLIEALCIVHGQELNPRRSIWPADRPCPPGSQ